MNKRVQFPTGPEALQREGLRAMPEAWEDGLRTENRPQSFERWSFEASLEDGSLVDITFFTKPLLERDAPLRPGVSISVLQPGQKKQNQVTLVGPREFSASKERCYIRAGESYVRADEQCYELHARSGDLSAHLNFTGVVPPWRPGAGKFFFDEAQERYFAWYAAIPYGTVEGLLTVNGRIHQVKGECYHDHRWGNTALNEVLSQWYWGRARQNDTTVLFAELTPSPAYGEQRIPLFFLAQGKEVRTGDGQPLRLVELDFEPDPGGRSYPTGIDLSWEKAPDYLRMALRSPQLLDSYSMVEFLPTLRRLVGGIVANPYYFRFKASMDLQMNWSGSQMREQGSALYELMLLR